MKALRLLLFIPLLFACTKHNQTGKSNAEVALPPRLQSYFEDYCGADGQLGIGFDASHTYDHRFRMRLSKTDDPELKRLYVLQHLHGEVEFGLENLKAGIKRTGLNSTRALTLDEWNKVREDLLVKINDLAAYSAFTNFATHEFDPRDRPDQYEDQRWLGELRQTFRSITNAPAGRSP